MKLLVFSKAPIQNFPRIFSLIFASSELGYEVEIVTQNIIKDSLSLLAKHDVKVHSIENKTGGGIRKIIHWIRFARFANKIYKNADSNTKIWVTGADTAMCMGVKTLKKKEFYFQINELYDKFPTQLRWIKKIVPYAKEIVVPEKNRAAIFQVWFDLKKLPLVLPNKPYFEDEAILSKESDYQEYIRIIRKEREKGKIVILYQGHLSKDRDMTPLIEGIKNEDADFCLIMMGKQHHGMLEKYKAIYPSLIYLSPIPAPYHLLVTKEADIGLLLYSPVSLNNIYCAPNKIWEYTKYGLAMLGNEIIGLDFIEENNIGKLINIEDPNAIKTALETLRRNHKVYENNSFKYYDSFDFKEELAYILK